MSRECCGDVLDLCGGLQKELVQKKSGSPERGRYPNFPSKMQPFALVLGE